MKHWPRQHDAHDNWVMHMLVGGHGIWLLGVAQLHSSLTTRLDGCGAICTDPALPMRLQGMKVQFISSQLEPPPTRDRARHVTSSSGLVTAHHCF